MFSVLLSIYYKENPRALKQCLDSILSQTRMPDEVVLVEDGDLPLELEKVVEKYKHKITNLKIISLATNVGLGKALNEGLKYCSYGKRPKMTSC